MNTITIDFGNKKFKELELIIEVDNSAIRFYPGNFNVQNNIWTFVYPDSIYDYVKFFSINDGRSDDTTANIIVFSTAVEQDTLNSASNIFGRGDLFLKGRFFGVQTYPDFAYRNKADKVIYKTAKEHNFFIEEQMDRELFVSVIGFGRGYSWFEKSYVGSQKTYSDNLEMYIALTKKYPTSISLLKYLAVFVRNYKSKEDVRKVYDAFSDSVKETYFAKKIQRFIDLVSFENLNLTAWDSNKLKPIIEYPNKFSLVVFSASWCVPCHKQMPIVREIAKQTGEKLDVIYISIDEDKTVESWREMVRKGEVPGRSLLALDKNKLLKDMYYVPAIPYSLLVYPGGKMETVDVRTEQDKNKIIQLTSLSKK